MDKAWRHGTAWFIALAVSIVAVGAADLVGVVHLARRTGVTTGGIYYERSSTLDVTTWEVTSPDGSSHRMVKFLNSDVISGNGKLFLLTADTEDGALDDDSEGAPDDIGVISASGKSHHRIWHVGDTVFTGALSSAGTEAAVALETNADRSGKVIQPNETSGLWTVNVHSGAHHLVAADGTGPVAWSPDGKHLAFILPASPVTGAPVALVVEPVSGGHPTTLTTFARRLGEVGFDLSWAPDGKTIMVAGRTPDGDVVETYPVTGGNPTILFTGDKTTSVCAATYSPDGTQIAVQTQTANEVDPLQRTQVDVGNADGTHLAPIIRQGGTCTDGATLAWAPDVG